MFSPRFSRVWDSFSLARRVIAANLGQLAGRSLRQWVARSTGSYMMSAAIGTLAGALVQSTNAVTVILMSMVKADLITPRQARPILVWSNVGTSVLVLAVAIDIHLFVLLLTATTGIFYYLNLDRSPRWRPFVAALLAISLLFLGLQLMHNGNQELRDIAWVREFFQMSARWSILAFGIGVVLAVALQSSSTVTVIAISMSAAGLFTLDQAMLTVLGASVGSGISTYMVASGMEGSSRQLAILQALVKILGVAALLPFVVVERAFHVPLLMALIRLITSDLAKQVALVYLACQIAAGGRAGRLRSGVAAALDPPGAPIHRGNSLQAALYLRPRPRRAGKPPSLWSIVSRRASSVSYRCILGSPICWKAARPFAKGARSCPRRRRSTRLSPGF